MAATATTGFGAAPAALSGFGSTGGFSFSQPASTSTGFGASQSSGFGATPSTGFGAAPSTGFGATPSTGFGAAPSTGFGAAPSTGFGAAPSTGFGAAPSTGFGSSFTTPQQQPVAASSNMFGSAGTAAPFGTTSTAAPTTLVPAAAPSSPKLNSRFNDLPEAYKNELTQTNLKYKVPMREGLDVIARFQPKMMDELRVELGRTNLAALKLGNQQELLLSEIRSFHDEAKSNLRDVRKYGASGLQQIQNRGGLGARSYLISEELPTDFYIDAANKIESRLSNLMEEVQHISRQLTSTLSVLSGDEGQYGQQIRIGPQQLVKLIQRQSEAFARVASGVADIHRQADDMRASYLQMHCKDDGRRYGGSHHGSDPFAAADRAEAASERLMSRKLKAEEFERANSNAAATAAAAVPQQAATTSAFGAAFPGTAAAAPAASNPFGSFTAPASFSSFGAAPATGFGAPAATGFGAVPAASGFGAAPSTGFGAPAAAAPAGFGSSFGLPATSGFGGGAGFKALDLATGGSNLGFGAAVPATSAFGAAFGGTTATTRKTGSKSRK
jgi:hypothetical protein